MSELYLIFFLASLVLFAGIVGFSVLQQRRVRKPKKAVALDEPERAETDSASSVSLDGDESPAVDPLMVKGSSATDVERQAPSLEAEAGEEKKISFKDKVAQRVARRGTRKSSKSSRTSKSDKPDRDRSSKSSSKRKRRKPESIDELPLDDASSTDLPPDQAKTYAPPSEQDSIGGKPKVDEQSSTVVTELVARVKNPLPIEQQELLSLFRVHDYKFHRKVHIYGLNQLTDLWRDIEFELPSARFVELGVSIQLADKEGAMSDKELHDFQQMTLEFSNQFDAPFEFSMQIDEALRQAQLLDQIGRRYDSMAVLNVVPKARTGFRVADIESCARDLMMSTDKNGIFLKTEGSKDNISVLYRLACTDGSGHFGLSSGSMTPVHDLVVYMNVPATKEPEAVFQQMVKDANSLATWLEGRVVDRNGRPMTQRSYSILMQQISDIAFSMQQDGLEPGDAISLKLF